MYSYAFVVLPALILIALSSGCNNSVWNNPYPASDSAETIYYDSFSERPKHLDPVSSYSANEYVFLGQIYEPPLQYHFLKRPYELIPLTVTEVPQPVYLDAAGAPLDADAAATVIHRVRYTMNIKPGILYQPHPAFAKDATGGFIYHDLTSEQLSGVHTLSDFDRVGTRELNADDYLYQIKRLAHPRVHSPIAGLMSQYILGLTELAEQLQSQGPNTFIDLREFDLAGARKLDAYRFEIILKKNYPQFLYWLSMSFFAPMPWEADYFYSQAGMQDRNITLDWFPVGTGPFMLTENNPNRRMVLRRNPHFRGEPYPADGDEADRQKGYLNDAGKAMPFLDAAVYSLEKEAIPAWNKFLQGYYDASGIVSDSFDQAVRVTAAGEARLTQAMQTRGIRLVTEVTTSTYYMGFNMADDVVGGDSERNRLLRRAIAIGADYEEFISIFANGRGIAAQGPIPPGIFGHVAGEAGINPYVYEWSNDEPVRRPIETARQLMVAAGYPNGKDSQTGKPLVLYLDTPATGPGTKSRFDWLRKQFAKLGIDLVIRATDYNRFQEKMRKGLAQIFQWGWNADYPDPENFFFLLYGPNAKIDNNGENAANYKNAQFDALFDRMKDMPNGETRQGIIDEMVAIVRQDSPWLWGFHPVGFALHHEWHGNVKPNLMANNTLKYKRIDSGLRSEKRRQWNQPIWWPVVAGVVVLVLLLLPAFISYKQHERAVVQ